jgi:hypothetical protein
MRGNMEGGTIVVIYPVFKSPLTATRQRQHLKLDINAQRQHAYTCTTGAVS